MKLSNWCQENCSTVGIGPLILTGLISTSQTRFRDGLAQGEVYYSISDGSSREAGIGVFNGTNTITRSQVHATLVNGLYNATSPVAIDLSGEAVVEGTFNTHAYQEIINTLATHTNDISGNASNIDALLLTAPTAQQKAGLDASLSPSNINAYITQSELNNTNSNLNTHINAPTGAHAASAVSVIPGGSITTADVQAALGELDNQIEIGGGDLSTHINNPTGAHTASAITNIPAGTIVATDTQAAINELNTGIQGHIDLPSGAHHALAIDVSPAGTIVATNTQAALLEIDTSLQSHINQTVEAHESSAISFDNTDTEIAAIDTQNAIKELNSNLVALDNNVSYRETAISALESGGVITQNGPTVVNIAEGQGEIINSYTDPENQITTEVDWVAQNFDLLLNGGMPVATGVGYTSIGMDTLGTPVVSPNGFSSGQRRNIIVLGEVEYLDQSISKVLFSPIVSNQVGNTLHDLIEYIELGSRIKGMLLRPTDMAVPDLSMWRDSGTLFKVGSNYQNSKADQNVSVIDAAGGPQTPFANFYPITFNSGTTSVKAPVGVVPVDVYEPAKDGVLVAISNGKTVIHYLFESLGGVHYMVYAQNQYATHDEAVTNLFADKASFSFPVETERLILLAQIVVVKGATEWGATAEIYPIDSATSSGSGTGSGSTAISVSYTDNYSIGSNVQVALDSLAKLKLSTNERAAMDTTSGVANPNVPTLTNYFVTVDDLTGANKLPIDADTLDGINSSQFARLDSDNSSIPMAPAATVDGRDISADGSTLDNTTSELITHTGNTANPHLVTAAQAGAATYDHTHAQTDIDNLETSLAAKVNKAGDTLTGQLKGITPVAAADLTRKDYVDLAKTGRNLIINGDFSVWQRGDSFTSLPGKIYLADRFKTATATGANGAFTVSKGIVGKGEDIPVSTFYRHNQTSAGSATDIRLFQQVLEKNPKEMDGVIYTYSFYYRSTIAFTANITLRTNFGTGGSPSADQLISLGFDVIGDGAWHRVVKTHTFDYNSSAFGTNNDGVFYAYHTLMAPINTNVCTFDITGIQLEQGDIATDFEIVDPATQFAKCQRYFQSIPIATASYFQAAFAANSGEAYIPIYFTPKRHSAPQVENNVALWAVRGIGIGPASIDYDGFSNISDSQASLNFSNLGASDNLAVSIRSEVTGTITIDAEFY